MALPLSEAFTARSLGVMWNNYKKNFRFCALPWQTEVWNKKAG